MSGLVLPFKIGDVMWAARHQPHEATIPCPVCAGQLAIVVILGDGEHVGVPCDGCGLGFNGPQGTIREWVYAPEAKQFTIARIKSMHDDQWSLESAEGGWGYFHELFLTHAEAYAESVTRCAEQVERNMETHQRKKKDTQRAGWSVRYHRENIKELQSRLAWHEAKVVSVKAGAK